MELSGKKDRVVLCCLTTEVVKVVEPIRFYEATRTHIITHQSLEDLGPDRKCYEFLNEARSRIESECNTELIIDQTNILDYQDVLRTIIGIVAEEKARSDDFVDIFINVSSGSADYKVSAMLVAMQQPDVIAFTVKTKSRNIDLEKAFEAITFNGKSVGITSEIYDPVMVMTFGSEMPEDKLVDCLAVISELKEDDKSPSFGDIIDKLKEYGIWDYSPEASKTRTDDSQKERMYFRRNFIDPLVSKGWIIEDLNKRNKYLLTKKGEAVIKIYYKGRTDSRDEEH
jgi:hypothetical protein